MNRDSHNQISSTFSSRRLGIHPVDQVGNLEKSDHQKTLTTNKWRNAPTGTHPPGLLVPFELPSRYSRTATFLHAVSRFGGPNPLKGPGAKHRDWGGQKNNCCVKKIRCGGWNKSYPIKKWKRVNEVVSKVAQVGSYKWLVQCCLTHEWAFTLPVSHTNKFDSKILGLLDFFWGGFQRFNKWPPFCSTNKERHINAPQGCAYCPSPQSPSSPITLGPPTLMDYAKGTCATGSPRYQYLPGRLPRCFVFCRSSVG